MWNLPFEELVHKCIDDDSPFTEKMDEFKDFLRLNFEKETVITVKAVDNPILETFEVKVDEKGNFAVNFGSIEATVLMFVPLPGMEYIALTLLASSAEKFMSEYEDKVVDSITGQINEQLGYEATGKFK